MLHYERKAKKKGFRVIAGIDEAGRGPLAGPVVAASVILGKKRFKARIYDSKKLSRLQRETAFFEILKSSMVSVGMVNNKEIDKINILNATRRAMKESALDLDVKPDCVLIDGNIKLDLPCYKECIIRGDSKSLSIAAASIVAKVVRDAIMMWYDKVYPQYGFRYHKGYGTKMHMESLRNFGPCPIHRETFSPIRSVKGEQ